MFDQFAEVCQFINMIPIDSYHFRINWNVSILIEFVFHFFVRHKLNSTMTNAEHARNETLNRKKKQQLYLVLCVNYYGISFISN